VIILSVPIDVVHAIHNAFRRDIVQIDNSALSIARNGGDFSPLFERIQIFSEVLDYHARGEEAAVFPAIDKVTPMFAKAYLMDHRELDIMTNGFAEIKKTPDGLTTARATAILNSHLRIHLNKEDTLLYPVLKERLTVAEQGQIAGLMSKQIPPEKFPSLVQWLFPLLDMNDQVVVTQTWKSLMPPPVFDNVKKLIMKTSNENWIELARRIPDLK
jgi:iron-sulfur cluster repair protein YtfE (RIC family)